MTHDEIRSASTAKLKDYLKQGFADVEESDMIEYELYIREFS
tara:strand:- start:1020 stop:1145 length:126 start_codon:yes stop_codon:yes gene_type:complete